MREVARRLQVSPSVIVRLRQRFNATGHVQDRPRSGRPKKTTNREDRYITRQAQVLRTSTANRIRRQLLAATITNIATQTVRNRLHAIQLRARRPAKCPKLSPANKAARQDWCRRHGRWTRQQWSQVVFTDECRFSLEHPDGRIRVWRRPRERFREDCIQPVTPYGGGSIMVYGGFSVQHRTPLYHVQGNLNAQRYRDEILVPLTVPLLRQIGPQAVLQDDNARPHRARLVDNFIQQTGVTRMEWPACSPDLNPIENLWDHLHRRVRENNQPPQTLQQLLVLLQMEWELIPQATLRTLVESMRRRCMECLANRGGSTHY
jgi:transposase